jgi:hypothetical protein
MQILSFELAMRMKAAGLQSDFTFGILSIEMVCPGRRMPCAECLFKTGKISLPAWSVFIAA